MKRGIVYLSSAILLVTGLLLTAFAYIEYTYLICVTVNGSTDCHTKVVLSFESQVFMSGVVITIVSLTIMLVYSLILLIKMRANKNRLKSDGNLSVKEV